MAAERPDKKEKKEKKEKRSEESGVSKPKKDKKEKKEKKEKLAAALEEKLQQDASKSTKTAAVDEDDDSEMEDSDKVEDVAIERTVVPFAVPLADEKGQKKVYKTIRKGMLGITLDADAAHCRHDERSIDC